MRQAAANQEWVVDPVAGAGALDNVLGNRQYSADPPVVFDQGRYPAPSERPSSLARHQALGGSRSAGGTLRAFE